MVVFPALGVTPGLGRRPYGLSPRAGLTPFPEHDIRSERHEQRYRCTLRAGTNCGLDARSHLTPAELDEQMDVTGGGGHRDRRLDQAVGLVAIGTGRRSVAH